MKSAILAAAGVACLLGAQALASWRIVPMRAQLVPTSDVYEAVEPGEFAGTLLLGGFRGLASDLLWMRAESAKDAGRFYESVALFRAISRIQPRFEQIWEQMASEMAYNIAAEAKDSDGRWAWFLAGVRVCADGCRRNPQSERLPYYLGWLFHHKGDGLQDRVEHDQLGRPRDWTGRDAPLHGLLALFEEKTRKLGLPALAEPPPGASTFAISALFFRASIRLAEATGVRPRPFLRRMIPIALERDGNIERNRGNHREALRRYIAALAAWAEVKAWQDQPPKGATAEMRSDDLADKGYSLESYQRQRGRLWRKVDFLARRLAEDPGQAVTFLAALDSEQWSAARTTLDQPNWRDHVERARIEWLDEPQPAADRAGAATAK